MARRKLPKKKRREHHVMLRVTSDQYTRLINYAKRHDVSISQAIRAVVFAQIP